MKEELGNDNISEHPLLSEPEDREDGGEEGEMAALRLWKLCGHPWDSLASSGQATPQPVVATHKLLSSWLLCACFMRGSGTVQ